jgi:hypothetical protein
MYLEEYLNMRVYKNNNEPPLFRVRHKEVVTGLTRERYAQLELNIVLISFSESTRWRALCFQHVPSMRSSE